MSTRCRIGIRKPDLTIESIYCHYDGYLCGVGVTLHENYQDIEKVKKLIAFGDIRGVAPDLDSIESYHNRGEDWESVKPKTYSDGIEIQRANKSVVDYIYVYNPDNTEGPWVMCNTSRGEGWHSLAKEIDKAQGEIN